MNLKNTAQDKCETEGPDRNKIENLVNFVIFPLFKTMTLRLLRNVLYESYCYIHNTVNSTVNSVASIEMELPQFQPVVKT